jgi:DNA replication protein DnaC
MGTQSVSRPFWKIFLPNSAKKPLHIKPIADLGYLEKLADGEAALRQDRATRHRLRMARFPVIKTLDQFNWSWPKSINRLQVQNLFRLQFVQGKSNIIFLGGVGLGNPLGLSLGL